MAANRKGEPGYENRFRNRPISGATRKLSALAAAMTGTRLTPVPAAPRAKMLPNWPLSKMAFGVIRALRHAASAFVSETVTIP
jgi:hypothetical protein